MMGNKAITQRESQRTLNSKGLRFTSQRALLLDLIQQGGGHLDADELHRLAKEKQPRISLSTVYRTLRTLKKLGLVEEVHFDENHHHYEVSPTREHHHLVCLGCGKVVEIHKALSRYVRKNVPEAQDFEIIDTELRMTGYCPECQQKKES